MKQISGVSVGVRGDLVVDRHHVWVVVMCCEQGHVNIDYILIIGMYLLI